MPNKSLKKITSDLMEKASKLDQKKRPKESQIQVITKNVETNPQSVIDEIMKKPDRIQLKVANIEGLDQTLASFRHQLSTKFGYIHGGGDTVVAGSNITITTNSGGQKVISSSASASPLTTKGDIFTFTTVNARLAVGSNGQFLKANSATATGLEWGGGDGTGDVVGPASAVSGNVTTFSGTTGKLIQDSGIASSSLLTTTTGQYKVFYTVGYSNADYIVDGTADEVQINLAIVAANAAGGGTVFIKEGAYNCAASVAMLSNVIIMGAGYGTRINVPGAFGVKATGGVSNIILQDIRIDGTSNSTYSVEIGNSSKITIQDTWITNAGNFACFVYAQDGNTTEQIKIVDNYFQQVTGAQDCLGGGPTSSNPTAVFRDIIITGNTLIKDLTAGGSNHNCFDMVAVKGITFKNNICYGDVVLGNEQDYNYLTQICGNEVHPPVAGTSCALLVLCLGSGTVTEGINVSGNTVDRGYIELLGVSGHIVKNCVVNNNIVYSTSGTNGIWLNLCDACVVNGNVCIGTSTAGRYGILIQSSTNTLVTSNYVNGYDNDIFDNTLSVTNLYANNITLNFLSAAVVASGPALNNMGSNPQKFYNQGNVTGATTFTNVNGDYIQGTLTGNITVTLSTPAGSRIGDRLVLKLIQDGTGSRTVTWPSNFKKAGGTLTLSTPAASVDQIAMRFDGTNWREESRALNQS